MESSFRTEGLCGRWEANREDPRYRGDRDRRRQRRSCPGTHNRITVQRVTETDELILADITVTGAGYNGGGVFAFQLDGNLIQGLTIRG